MPVNCPDCGASLGDLLHGEVTEDVQEHLLRLYDYDVVKIDHVRRGDEQECWACRSPTRGFHLYKARHGDASQEFFKLCDSCAAHIGTFLAHLVSHEEKLQEPVGQTDPQ